MRFGRPPVYAADPEGTNGTAEGRPRTESYTAAGRILALGCAMIAGFFVVLHEPVSSPKETLPPEAVAVMSTAVTGIAGNEITETTREDLAAAEETADPAGTEPFGYMDGEWNLWEYIGDLMWSLLS